MTIEVKTEEWTDDDFFENVFANLTVDVDKRIELNQPKSFQLYFNKNNMDKSEALTFTAKTKDFGVDPTNPTPKPIKVGIKVNYDVDCRGKSSLECPTISSSTLEHSKEVQLVWDLKTGCAQHDKCRCNMKFSSPTLDSQQVKVGEQNDLELPLEVTNSGTEPAYGVKIVFSSEIDFPKVEGPRGFCKSLDRNGNRYEKECALQKVAKATTIESSFRFKLPTDFEGKNRFNISAELKDSCNGGENSQSLTNAPDFDVKFNASIEVKSEAHPSQIM